MLKAKLPTNDKTKKPFQPGDLRFAEWIRKQNTGSNMTASTMNARAKKFVRVSAICSGKKKAAYRKRPLIPNNPIPVTHHSIILCIRLSFTV